MVKRGCAKKDPRYMKTDGCEEQLTQGSDGSDRKTDLGFPVFENLLNWLKWEKSLKIAHNWGKIVKKNLI